MRRRNAITIVALVGLDVITGKPTEAREHGVATAGRPQQDPVSTLIGVVTAYAALPKEDRDAIKAAFKEGMDSACSAVGRAWRQLKESFVGAGIGGKQVTITVNITKHPKGYLVLNGQLENVTGSGAPHVTHHGTAAHHRHPDFRMHLGHIVENIARLAPCEQDVEVRCLRAAYARISIRRSVQFSHPE